VSFSQDPGKPNPLDNTWVHPENYRLAERSPQMVAAGATSSDSIARVMTCGAAQQGRSIREPVVFWMHPRVVQRVGAFRDLGKPCTFGSNVLGPMPGTFRRWSRERIFPDSSGYRTIFLDSAR